LTNGGAVEAAATDEAASCPLAAPLLEATPGDELCDLSTCTQLSNAQQEARYVCPAYVLSCIAVVLEAVCGLTAGFMCACAADIEHAIHPARAGWLV
jgi:hypothetical protein